MGSAYFNLDKVNIKGFDTELKVDVNENLYCWGNFTFQDPRCVESKENSNWVGKQVPNIPRIFANFGFDIFIDNLIFRHGKGKLFWSGGYTDEYYFNWQTTTRDRSRLIPESFTQDAGIEFSLLIPGYR